MADIKKRPRCGLVCVGSELLRGKVNTHASTVARRLAMIGLELGGEETVSDELKPLTDAIRRALGCFDVVFVTGGLGPTFDDVTREASAEALGRPLHLDKKLLAGIVQKFRRARYRKMPPANARQASLLEGAVALENTAGTAPGQWLDLGNPSSALRAPSPHGRRVVLCNFPLPRGEGGRRPGEGQVLILLPGPPSELVPMLDRSVLPRLRKLFPPSPQAEAHLHFVGVPESFVDHRVRPVIERAGPDVQFTILAHLGLVDLDVFVRAETIPRAQKILNRLVRQIQRAVGPSFYGMNEAYPLEKVVGDLLRRRHAVLALAESCTGGGLAARLTDVAGSSRYFRGGVVAYSDRVKRELLDVPEALLKKHGAVSAEAAAAMAQGVRRRLHATHGLSITGIAGPGGGRVEKPVGLVYIALSTLLRTKTWTFRFPGDRAAIRQRSGVAALDLLRQALT